MRSASAVSAAMSSLTMESGEASMPVLLAPSEVMAWALLDMLISIWNDTSSADCNTANDAQQQHNAAKG